MRLRVQLLFSALIVPIAAGCGDEITNITQVIGDTTTAGPRSGQIVALNDYGVVFWVDPAAPDVVLGALQPSGLPAGDQLITLAYRLTTNQLFGRSEAGGFWVVRLDDGVVTRVGGANFVFGGATTHATAFSPAADLIRLVTNTRQSARFNPVTGVPVVDDTLATAGTVVGIAYAPVSAGGPTLYGINRTASQLVRIGGVGGTPSPNLGAVTPIGPLGTPAAILGVGFAIASGGLAYASIQMTNDFTARLYSVNLTTGAATVIGPMGTGGAVVAMVMVP